MDIKWLITIIASMIFCLYVFLPRKRHVSDGYNYKVDVIGRNVLATLVYFAFWIIWLLIF